MLPQDRRECFIQYTNTSSIQSSILNFLEGLCMHLCSNLPLTDANHPLGETGPRHRIAIVRVGGGPEEPTHRSSRITSAVSAAINDPPHNGSAALLTCLVPRQWMASVDCDALESTRATTAAASANETATQTNTE